MKTILSHNVIMDDVVGKQAIKYDKEYRLIAFSHITKNDNTYLIYNTLTKELIALDDEENEILKAGNYDFKSEFICELIKKWFLVPTDFNEFKLCDQIAKIAKSIESKLGIWFYNIFTTTACNARCFYCFEAGTKPKTMTLETAEKVADYIIKNRIEREITLHWFGGEPLCNTKVIDLICDKVNAHSTSFRSVIVTNGYLLDKELIKKAKNRWNVKYVQITLDGMGDTYNRVKNYVNPVGNPFEKVINNIGLLIKNEIFVSVRMNMDLYNEKELYALTDLLVERFGPSRYIEINTNIIYEDVGFVPTKRNDKEREELQSKFFKLVKYQEDVKMIRRKFLPRKIRTGRCSADSYHAVQILPCGELGNCEHYPDKYFYGTIFNDEPRQLWTDYAERLDICKTCAYYPECFILKRCNTKQCSDFRKKRILQELDRNVQYTYEVMLRQATK